MQKYVFEWKFVAFICRGFTGVYSCNRIALEPFGEIHSSYGLNIEKHCATIADNGSNPVRAFKQFGR